MKRLYWKFHVVLFAGFIVTGIGFVVKGPQGCCSRKEYRPLHHKQDEEKYRQPNRQRGACDDSEYVSSILKRAGIRHYMESSSGIASIMAQSDRSREAVDLIRKDATQRGYWMSVPKEFQ